MRLNAVYPRLYFWLGSARGVRSGSFNISERDDKREQVSTILVNISVNEAVVGKYQAQVRHLFQA